jgi:hypothetical protein
MTMALEGGEGSASRPGCSLPRERPRTHCTGGWVGPRAGLDRCRKSPPPLGFDARTVQPIASRYTDWATRPTNREEVKWNAAVSFTEQAIYYLFITFDWLLLEGGLLYLHTLSEMIHKISKTWRNSSWFVIAVLSQIACFASFSVCVDNSYTHFLSLIPPPP